MFCTNSYSSWLTLVSPFPLHTWLDMFPWELWVSNFLLNCHQPLIYGSPHSWIRTKPTVLKTNKPSHIMKNKGFILFILTNHTSPIFLPYYLEGGSGFWKVSHFMVQTESKRGQNGKEICLELFPTTLSPETY